MNQKVNPDSVKEFAIESNYIEGIRDTEAHDTHTASLLKFLDYKCITIARLEEFVKEIEPKAFLRTQPQHCCFIGGRKAPNPSRALPNLKFLLTLVNDRGIHPYRAHCEYEILHPFMDGNGRSGRALWLWQMVNHYNFAFEYPFLQSFYYQALRDRGLKEDLLSDLT